VQRRQWSLLAIMSSEFISQSYFTIRHDRSDGYGGVLIVIHNDPDVIEYLVGKVVTCKILFPDMHGSYYFMSCLQNTQLTQLTHLEAVISTLTDIVHSNHNSPIWIDLLIINLNNGSISGNNYPHSFADHLLDFVSKLGFTQMVVSPTKEIIPLISSLQINHLR